MEPQRTPDGRYIIVAGVLWRASNPSLPPPEHARLVQMLMEARRTIGAAKRAGDMGAVAAARAAVHSAKLALGERGPVWWDDGSPDWNRRRVENTTYAQWWKEHVSREN